MDEWLSCQGQWRKSALYFKIKSSRKTSHHGARLWMTFGQISAKYGSEDIARDIVKAKTEDPEVAATQSKPHPDCPQNKAWYWGF